MTTDGQSTDAEYQARDERYRSQARTEYATDEVEIDEGATVSIGDRGAWVAAWVYVPNTDVDDDDPDPDPTTGSCPVSLLGSPA
jgi:hypothetical protein